MTKRAAQLHHDNAPAHSTALVQGFWQSFWLFQKLKLPLKGRRFVNVTDTQYTTQSTASQCRLTSPMGE